VHVAKSVNPFLPPDETNAIWSRIREAPCYKDMHEFQRRWIGLFAAVGARDAVRMAELASDLLANQTELTNDSREYLLMAAMTGYVASGSPEHARTIWGYYSRQIPKSSSKPIFRCCAATPRPAPTRIARAYSPTSEARRECARPARSRTTRT
jgi:hypothetical protein